MRVPRLGDATGMPHLPGMQATAGTHLLSGGTGGLGLLTARWLAQLGAWSLDRLSRRGYYSAAARGADGSCQISTTGMLTDSTSFETPAE